MNSKLLVGLVVLVLGVGVGWYVLKANQGTTGDATLKNDGLQQITPPEASDTGTTGQTSNQTGTQGTEKGGVPSGQAIEKTTVSYTDSGFTPKSVTVKQGTTVTFTNNSSTAMWVASDVHPTHQLLPGFDELKSIQKGGTYEYTFVKVGTWTYHNHTSPGDKGTVAVTK